MPEYTEADGKALSASEVRGLYNDLRGQYSARNSDYLKIRDRYAGQHWDGGTGGTGINTGLTAEEGRYSLTVNYLRKLVDKAVEDLFGKMPGLQVVPPNAQDDGRRQAEKEEALLYSTWGRNRMEAVLRQVAFNAIALRRGYIQYWWDPAAKVVRYKSIAPENVYPVLDGDEMTEVIVVSQRLTRGLKARYPGKAITSDIEGDDVVAEVDEDGGQIRRMSGSGLLGYTRVIDWYDRHGNWVRVMGDAEHTQNLAYGTDHPPIIEFANNMTGENLEPHGELDDVVELNLYLDQLYSQQADIIRKYSNPPVVDEGSGQSPQAIRRIIAGDGGVIPVRKGARLSYLNWEGTLPEIGAQMDRTERFLQDLGGQPASAFGQTVTNQSGVMTNLSLTPTVKATAAREVIFGMGLVTLNADTLRIYEKFLKGQPVKLQGVRFGRTPYQEKAYEEEVSGSDVNGWYENRIKWPSALRIDDPVYVQSEIAKVTCDPPVQSVYDTIENLGVPDVEAALDRIAAQLEDPRFHPDRLKHAVDAAAALGGAQLPTDLEGLAGGGVDPTLMNDAAESVGSPDRDALASGPLG